MGKCNVLIEKKTGKDIREIYELKHGNHLYKVGQDCLLV